MPSRPDLSFAELDDYVYKTKMSETSISKTSKDIVEKPKTVRPSDPIIEDWDTDSDNDIVFRPKTDQTKPKFTKINFVKSDENVKSVNKENTHKQVEYPRKGQSPREKPVLNNKGRVTGQRENRPVWNNVQRANHQNKLTHPHLKRNFVPTAVATKLGQVPVNAAKQNSLRAAASISTSRPVNTTATKSKVNDALPKTYSYFKAHSPIIKRLMVDLLHLEDKCPNRKITRKGKIRTGKLDFEDVYFVKELKFNLFSVSQMCDKKNSVLFTKPKCLVLSPDFKLLDESQVVLKVPRQNNMYSFELKNVVPLGGLTCLFAKATIDESNLWHRRLGHINFKTMNKLVRGNLDETSEILKTFITGIENQINHKIKIIRCDNGTEFENNDMNQFCGIKEIKREFSVARTPQQNGIAKRNNRTLIEAVRTMLVDSFLPTTSWAEAVSTACYVQNRVLVTKPHNKTPYELLHGRPPSISFMRLFGCPVTILNTLDPLGKFDGKADEGF
ncbi:ribonuclease H-like domain-containing protein [Tanacetum coccineum]